MCMPSCAFACMMALRGCFCAVAYLRGHEVLVAVMAAGHGYAKRAAARHSSNSTAEALHYLVLSQQEQQHEQQQRATDPSTSGSRLAAAAPAEAGHSRSQLKHPGRYSSGCCSGCDSFRRFCACINFLGLPVPMARACDHRRAVQR